MRTLEDIKKILAKHKSDLHENFHVKNIGLFGSCARGDRMPGSDVDILVEFDQPVGWEIVDLHEHLEDILDAKVDLVTKGAVMRKPLLWESIREDLIHV